MKMNIVILLALAAFLATASALRCHTCGVPEGPGELADSEVEMMISNCANGKGWKEEECNRARRGPGIRHHNSSCHTITYSGKGAGGYTKLNHIYDKLVF